MNLFLCVLIFVFLTFKFSVGSDYCDVNRKETCSEGGYTSRLTPKYIFYDVNAPEGFNLRRDVYLRMAVFIRRLKKENWILVLTPWPHLYHWFSQDIQNQNGLPWSLFFNMTHLSSFIPVIEMNDFLQTGQKAIDQVYVLQHFEDTFSAGNFNDRMKVEPCQDHLEYERVSNGYVGMFWPFKNVTAKKVECLSFHGPASQLLDIIKKTEVKSIMFDHAEIVLHDRFGDKIYWDARRSMKFADHLLEEGARFRKEKLNSSDESDGTVWPNNKRTAIGGNYLCAHLRRRDFLSGRSKDVPSIKGAAEQIEKALNELGLNNVFIATDAPKEEKSELRSHLEKYNVFMYKATRKAKETYKDGGIAIIEQIICSHARKFIGTHESTFSFRIQEEREIMGFKPETTFNRFCGDNAARCKPPSKWLIVY